MKRKTPVCHELPYTPEYLLQIFAPLSGHPWAMLLHSGFANHTHSRFDILVADPLTTLVTHAQSTQVESNGIIETYSDDPFEILQRQLDALPFTASASSDLPFQGGAVGLFGYDLGRHVETLPILAERDIDLPDMAIGIYDWALIADHQQKTLQLVCHGDIATRLQWLKPYLSPPQPYAPRSFTLKGGWQANMTQEEYSAKFVAIQRYIRRGDCYQINLTQRFSADYQGDEWQAFLQLSRSNQAPFSAFIRLPQHCVLSISPERFLWLQDQQIQTRPIKGTLPRLNDPIADQQQALALAHSTKDQAENLMIVDLMRNDIGRVAAPGSVQVPELFIVEPFPAVHHLVSTITATLPAHRSAAELLRACFPGGSITGAPKIRAMEIIEELEPQRRNAYCGSIGYISCCGTMDTSITIRTLFTQNSRIYCSAGGGIVADSQVLSEYQETFDKVARILPLLQISDDKI